MSSIEEEPRVPVYEIPRGRRSNFYMGKGRLQAEKRDQVILKYTVPSVCDRRRAPSSTCPREATRVREGATGCCRQNRREGVSWREQALQGLSLAPCRGAAQRSIITHVSVTSCRGAIRSCWTDRRLLHAEETGEVTHKVVCIVSHQGLGATAIVSTAPRLW